MTPILHIISALIYTLAYALAALYAHWNEQHREMCPVYAAITFASALHLIVIVLQHRIRSADQPSQSGDRSPIPNAKRTVYYDDHGDVIYVEWAPLPAATSRAAAPNNPPAQAA